jgi:ribosomal-protein-alanine N-acetyltransferase
MYITSQEKQYMSLMEFPATFPQMETKRLVLRELSHRDTEALFQNYSDEDISNNFMDAPFTKLEQAKYMIDAFNAEYRRGNAITWAISLKGASVLIGTCSYMIESSSNVEIGYDLSKAHWGNGLMYEALYAIIDFGFNSLGFQK